MPLPPEIETADHTILPVPNASEPDPDIGFAVNARIQPHGRPTKWWVEYGPTAAYGSATVPRPLPGKLDAHFVEYWTGGLNGWDAGYSTGMLAHRADETPCHYVRYGPDPYDDPNHMDGIGVVRLPLDAYVGKPGSPPLTAVQLCLGGGHLDLRGAKVSMWMRGVGWSPHGTELGTWIQTSLDTTQVAGQAFANWAHTGAYQTPHLVSGGWQFSEWTLRNTNHEWTYAGREGKRMVYLYRELDAALGDIDEDIFPLQVLYVNMGVPPTGAIDFRALHLTYRQHSLLAPSNGGALASEPAGGTGSANLTDGWRTGLATWTSEENPAAPQVFVYEFAKPVTLDSVTVHNDPQFPSRHVRIDVSDSNGGAWIEVGTLELPDAPSPQGDNLLFAHLSANDGTHYLPLHATPLTHLRVTVESGYRTDYWGLSQIEAFGSGADEATDDEWYDVNQNVVVPFGEYHYRIVAESDEGTAYGPDQSVTVPIARLRGINLTGAADPAWQFPGAAAIDYYADRGFTCVRIPFAWQHIQSAPSAPLDPVYLYLLKDCVRHAVETRQLTAIVVPVQRAGGFSRADFANLWAQLAAQFADRPYGVIFDLLDEPHDLPADGLVDPHERLCAAYNEAIAAIRAVGAKNLLLLQGLGGSYASEFAATPGVGNGAALHALIADPGDNWAAAVRNYPDTPQAGGEGWATTATSLEYQMWNVTGWCAESRRRVFVTDFAAVTSDPLGAAVVHGFLTELGRHPHVPELGRRFEHVVGWAWRQGADSSAASGYNIAWDAAEDDLKYHWLSPFLQTPQLTPPPSIASVVPESGQVQGGDSVTINGAGFLPTATVEIDFEPVAAITNITSTSITFTTAAHAAGTYTLRVTNPDLQLVDRFDAFTFV